MISSLACMPGDSKFHKTTGHESQFLHLQGLMEFEIPVPGSSGRNCAWKLALTFSHVLSCRIPLWPRFRAKVTKTARIFLIDSDKRCACLEYGLWVCAEAKRQKFSSGSLFLLKKFSMKGPPWPRKGCLQASSICIWVYCYKDRWGQDVCRNLLRGYGNESWWLPTPKGHL